MRIRASGGIWLIVGLIVCIVVLVLGYFLIIQPKRNSISDVEADIEDIESTISVENNRLTQLKQYEEDPEQFLRQIDILKERIPETVELADIIQQLDHAAEEAGLDFASFIPANPVITGNLYVVTCQTNFTGRYFNLVEFFNHIERLPRSIKVVYLSLAGSENGLPYLDISLTLRAYFTTEQGVELLIQTQQ
jgi:type IV pilus assembly protein PilO